MLSTVSLQPVHISPNTDYSASAQEQPVEAPAGANAHVPGETPATPPLPPWLEPSNFDFLRRVAQALSDRRDG
ncbi:MAG TPA: hypothetical protein VK524_13010 [Polyangiaceae bacterium]|nr:hypothetical protein [Polyangiaceae bacterium]